MTETYELLQLGIFPLVWLDTLFTYEGMWNRGFGEQNPLVRLYIGKPSITILLDMGTCVGLHRFSGWLYRKSKVLGYLFVGTIYAVQGYVLWRHWRLRR